MGYEGINTNNCVDKYISVNNSVHRCECNGSGGYIDETMYNCSSNEAICEIKNIVVNGSVYFCSCDENGTYVHGSHENCTNTDAHVGCVNKTITVVETIQKELCDTNDSYSEELMIIRRILTKLAIAQSRILQSPLIRNANVVMVVMLMVIMIAAMKASTPTIV